MTVLRSYVNGAWTAPAGGGRPVLDAVTGEEVARVSSSGIDLGAALGYGRSVGGPALRELTFHQRATLLKSLGLLLREHRQELYALSARTGATAAAWCPVLGGDRHLLRPPGSMLNGQGYPPGGGEP